MPLCVPQVFASLGGMVAPPLGTWLLASTGQWYPVIAAENTLTTLRIEIAWRCPAITAWESRTWSSHSSRWHYLDESALGEWLLV